MVNDTEAETADGTTTNSTTIVERPYRRESHGLKPLEHVA